ncbi:hypothetical protein CBOM_07313 [Ceraceosorus bombacis]|uniref:Uncharacterized protein n=1 Tax=Ceraceosorus bombacis TaxID=401625 RepID=A0A0P1B844_9BASI|nr:hypothetical protein CBOM_07313 [Ceraceosorus bombacis]
MAPKVRRRAPSSHALTTSGSSKSTLQAKWPHIHALVLHVRAQRVYVQKDKPQNLSASLGISCTPPSAAQTDFEARVARYLEKRKHRNVFAWTMVKVLLLLAGYTSDDKVPTPLLDCAFQMVVDVWLKVLRSNNCAAPPAAAATITPQGAKAHLNGLWLGQDGSKRGI